MRISYLIRSILLGSIVFLGGAAKAQSLQIGDIAPPLDIIKWLKGKPISSFEKGKIYVVEFGYVACPPCRASIPHLSDLARKYRDQGKVEVISVFTAESDPKNLSDLSYIKRIQGLVDFMGNKMDYSIAVDDPSQKTRKSWGNSQAFPTFYIIDGNGKIAYNLLRSFAELDFALESIVNTGRYDYTAFQRTKGKEIDATYYPWNMFVKDQKELEERGDYAKMLYNIDSVFAISPIEKKERLLLSKFKIYMKLQDSIAADNCLEQIFANKQQNWEGLHEQFQYFIPPLVSRAIFNYDRYLVIAERAIKELGTPYLQASHMIIQSRVIYGYKHDKAQALAVLHKALKIVKSSGINKDVKEVESEIEMLERNDKVRKQADIDWRQLTKSLEYPTKEELDIIQKEKGNVGYQQCLAKHKAEQTSMAEDFWDKYPEDERRSLARMIFMNANFAIVPWMDDISEELAFKINGHEKQLRADYFKYKPDRNLAYGHPYFRMLPINLKAFEKWEKKGDEMFKQAMYYGTIVEKEALDWDLFCRDWRTASFYYENLPYRDERPDDEISIMETQFWKGMAAQYWERFWARFNDHVVKYPDLDVLTERAGDFLSGTSKYAPELIMSYWQNIIDTYGNSKHPLALRTGVKALCKRAKEQLYILKIEKRESPVDMKFTSMDGIEVDLAKYKGKIVLIDFWATWCKPCVGEMPVLKAVYDKYHHKGFEMIGICLDEEIKREEVKNLLAKNSLIGPQRFEGRGFDGDRYKQLYGIFALPTAWLLDKDGMLVSTNARGEELERLLEKYLEESK